MEACARCGSLDHCVSFCPRLTKNGTKPVKRKGLYFFLVTCRTGLPPAIAAVDPRVIDPERWEKEVEYPQTPALARHRREGVLNGTLPGRLDLNLWNELDVNTGLSLGLQIHPAHAPGGQHRCCYRPSQTQENTGSTSQAEQPSRKSKDTTDSVLHATIAGRFFRTSRPEISTRGRGRGLGESDRGRDLGRGRGRGLAEIDRGTGFGRGRGVAPRGGGDLSDFGKTQPLSTLSLPSQDEFHSILELNKQHTEERLKLMNFIMEAQTKSQTALATAMSARRYDSVGGVHDASFEVDGVPRHGGSHGLEYPGHLPSRGRGGAPRRGYLGTRFLAIEERRARDSQLGSQTLGQGGQSQLYGLPALQFGEQGLPIRSVQLPYGLPALQFGEQGLPIRSVQPAQAQGSPTLPAGPPSSTFEAQGTPHQNSGNPGGAPNQQ